MEKGENADNIIESGDHPKEDSKEEQEQHQMGNVIKGEQVDPGGKASEEGGGDGVDPPKMPVGNVEEESKKKPEDESSESETEDMVNQLSAMVSSQLALKLEYCKTHIFHVTLFLQGQQLHEILYIPETLCLQFVIFGCIFL